MSRIVFSGYYGFDNLGDEAVLAASVAVLRSRRPGVHIAVLSADPAATERALEVQGVPRARLRSVVRALWRCDAFLSGGGSLFQDTTSWRSPWYYLALLALARCLARRTAVYAQGIGPLRGRAARWAARWLLNRVDLITVRDTASLEALVSLGVKRKAGVLAADPALLLTPERSDGVRAERARWGDGLHFGLALRAWGDDAWCEAVTAAARSLAERDGIRWICLPMHRPRDLDIAERVAAGIGAGARVVRAPFTPREMLALIGDLRLLVGARLHALIFAATQGVPAVALSYDPKVAAFAGEIGEPCLPLDGLTAASVADLVRETSADAAARRVRLLAAVAPLQARARRAPDLAADLLS